MKRILVNAVGFLVFVLALLLAPVPARATELNFNAACTGTVLNPFSDLDWNLMFPITVAGVPYGGGTNPPLMDMMPPVCVCPTVFGFPLPGIGVTYWEPLYIGEIELRPGCLSSLGGVQVLRNYAMLHSEGTADDGETSQTNRLQIHWYQYPVMSMLDMFSDVWCKNPSGFDLAFMTEIDPTWQDDAWGAVFTPETGLFANVIAQAACAIDATATNLGFPLDMLFWCAGSWGGTYPLTGNAGHNQFGHNQSNQLLSKFIARNARLGLQFMTIGPLAICESFPNPVWVKSQYRFDQVAPVVRKGPPVGTGNAGLFQFPPVANMPMFEHTVDVIWQGKQCCLKVIP